jgi:hypothetical protein
MKIWAIAAGIVVVAGAVFGLVEYNAEPPPVDNGAVRLTLAPSGLPPVQHRYAGGAVSLNAMLGDDVALIGTLAGAGGPGSETRVRAGQTIQIPGGTLRLVHVWNMWQRDHDAVDVVLTPG